jgi:ABC-2 type transport system permease protein
LIAISHAGSLFASITRAIPAFVVALFFIGLMPPVSTAAMVCFFVTAFFGCIIYMLISLIISYTAFWLIDYWYLEWFNWALFGLFGGTKLPMWFYPDWLTAICYFLPFRYAVFQPMAFYLGRVPVNEFGFSICLQLFWITVLFFLERFVWHLSQRKLIVQGG